MTIRLIALDVDGTILNDHHELTDGVKQAIKAASVWATIVLATGRGPSNAVPVMHELGLRGVVITHNGGATIETGDNRIVHQYPFPIEDILPYVQYCRKQNVHFDISSPFALHVERLGEEERRVYEQFLLEPELLQDVMELREPVVKMTVSGPSDQMDRVEQDWRSFPGTRLNIIRSGEQFVDLMHPEASKGNALRKLAENLEIPREQVLAIGNYYNDLDMIRYAGLGIAMANSPEDVKQAADKVTLSNNEDGVKAALEQLVLAQ